MGERGSKFEGLDYLLELHLSRIGYDNGYCVAIRAVRVASDTARPHGLQYSLTLHGEDGDRILGYDNSHRVDAATGPGRKSRRPAALDHIDRKGRRSVPYRFTTPFKLLEDFFAAVDDILRKEGAL
jgi:Family of unknown function (DUF6516)